MNENVIAKIYFCVRGEINARKGENERGVFGVPHQGVMRRNTIRQRKTSSILNDI